MTFRPKSQIMTIGPVRVRLPVVSRLIGAALCGIALMTPVDAGAGGATAVIPTETLYPGQVVDAARLQVVDVTNPNLTGDYATALDQVVGKVTNRTLLAGRVILVAALREPYAVERGKAIRIVYSNGPLTITAGGAPLDNASIGDLIRVRNTDSGLIVSGTVMADGTVHVVAR